MGGFIGGGGAPVIQQVAPPPAAEVAPPAAAINTEAPVVTKEAQSARKFKKRSTLGTAGGNDTGTTLLGG